jgi:hypothetical protein
MEVTWRLVKIGGFSNCFWKSDSLNNNLHYSLTKSYAFLVVAVKKVTVT